MRSSRAVPGWVVAVSLLVVGLVGALACDGELFVVPSCQSIPAGGCPGGDDDRVRVCGDPSCSAVYACQWDGGWREVGRCEERPAVDGGGAQDAGEGGAVGGDDDGGQALPPGASGGPGCRELQPPDCPVALAAACAPASCCECEDLFVCENGGWVPWGTCEGGRITSP